MTRERVVPHSLNLQENILFNSICLRAEERFRTFYSFCTQLFIRSGEMNCKVKFPLYALRDVCFASEDKLGARCQISIRRGARRSGVCRFVWEKEPLCHKSHWLRVTLNQLFRLKQRHFKFLHAPRRLSLCSRVRRTKNKEKRSPQHHQSLPHWKLLREGRELSTRCEWTEVLFEWENEMEFCAH